MADEAAVKEASEGGTPPKKSKMMFIILGVAIVLLGGGGFFAYTKFIVPKPAIDGEAEEHIAKVVEKEPIAGEMMMLEPFVVNLSDPAGKRYLKIIMGLELESAEVIVLAEKAVPRLRDAAIMMLTSLTFEEVMTPEGKLQIRDELLERFNQILRPKKVLNLYFTEFVVQ